MLVSQSLFVKLLMEGSMSSAAEKLSAEAPDSPRSRTALSDSELGLRCRAARSGDAMGDAGEEPELVRPGPRPPCSRLPAAAVARGANAP